MLAFTLLLGALAASSSSSPSPTDTPAPFSCDAPAPPSPLPRSPRMVDPSPDAIVSKDRITFYFDSSPDRFVQLRLEGSDGIALFGGSLEPVERAPANVRAAHIAQASIPTEKTYARFGISANGLPPVLKAGVRYRVSFDSYPRCPERYEGDSGYFVVR